MGNEGAEKGDPGGRDTEGDFFYQNNSVVWRGWGGVGRSWLTPARVTAGSQTNGFVVTAFSWKVWEKGFTSALAENAGGVRVKSKVVSIL